MDRVLVVDDSKSALEFFKYHIADLPGCEAVPFAEPRAALEWCLKRRRTWPSSTT